MLTPSVSNQVVGEGAYQEPLECVVQNLIHDLRQPLSTIQNCAFYLGLVLPDSPEKAEEQLSRLEREVEEACRLLTEASRRLKFRGSV